jgi:hypothetical protein
MEFMWKYMKIYIFEIVVEKILKSQNSRRGHGSHMGI